MKEVEEFVHDHTQGQIKFSIQSFSLKKALGKRVTDLYMGTGVFAEFTRQSPEAIVKKSKSFNQI